ncbi:MAG TPA: aminotransferase class IV [Leptolyngbyaceae cyanobacterium]
MYWFNGQLFERSTIALSIDDPALLYGATVFTTLRVYESLAHPLTAWQTHCDRILHSLQTFHWPEPNWEQVQQGSEALAQIYPILRITVLPDGRELITGRFLPADLRERQNQGITAWVASSTYQRSLPEQKTGNYLSCFLAMQEAKRQEAKEAILQNNTGNWLETSTGTLWGWGDGAWWTPPLEAGVLPGVVRSHLLIHLKNRGHPVIETPWTPERVRQFECMAYSNCVVQIVPIHTVVDERIRLEYNPDCEGLRQLRIYWP